jgi:hypothetical protein
MGDELMRLQDVLEGMPETQRRAILLREWQGLSYREIANELDVSQSAVETLIFRARRSLAAGLEVEQTQWRRRARHGFDAGTIVAALKGLLTAGTAAKVAATIAVATTAAVVVSGSHRHAVPRARTPLTHAAHTSPTSASPTFATLVTPAQRVVRHFSAAPVHHTAVASQRSVTSSAPAPATPSTEPAPPPLAVDAPPPASNASASARVPDVSRPVHSTPHGLAKGQVKHAQAHAAVPPAAQPVVPSAPDEQDQPNAADQGNDAAHGNGHGHG